MKSFGFALLALLLIGVGGYAGWRFLVPAAPNAGLTEDQNVAQVTRQDIALYVRVAGDIEPVVQVEVRPEISARIKKLNVQLGQTVNAGDLLVELDDKELLTERNAAEIEIVGARVEAEKAKRDHERDQRLFEKQLISAQTVSDSGTRLELAENTLRRAQSRLQTVKDRLEKTRVLAPMSGTILELPVVEGQVVVGAGSVNSGTVLMKLARMDRLQIATHVNQVDVAKLRPGMSAEFSVDSIQTGSMPGTIERIAPTATVRRNIKGFTVEILIENPDPRLRPGMTAEVRIPIDKAEGVLAVPLAAVFNDPAGGRVTFVRTDGNKTSAEKRPVEIGIANLDFVQIKNGLKENEVVLLTRPQTSPSGG
ncbi:MAG: efflux RND transporter periplasmic adaptor subunit [Candidatus Methylacidiphilales bacterium]